MLTTVRVARSFLLLDLRRHHYRPLLKLGKVRSFLHAARMSTSPRQRSPCEQTPIQTVPTRTPPEGGGTGIEAEDTGSGTEDAGTGIEAEDTGMDADELPCNHGTESEHTGMKTAAESGGCVRSEGEGSECVEISEGRAKILFPSHNEVFYNPVQEFNRDLSIAVIKHYASIRTPSKRQRHQGAGVVTDSEALGGQSNSKDSVQPGLRVLEALAASGLRSIRYALEIPQLDSVVANDYSKDAYNSMCRNVEHNGVAGRVEPSWREASMLMYEHREPHSKRFDVIDLDPYGSPSIFLDSSIQAVQEGGLLCVTCTDMSVLCGNHSESCHSKYGSMSLKAKYCHEMALRIVLSSLESHANRYRRYIVPLLSCSIDFYVRLFVRVFTSAQEVKRSPSKLAMVYHCTGCESFHLQPVGKRMEKGKSRSYPPSTGPPVNGKCEHCRFVFKFGGPIWAEPIHDPEFVSGLLSEVKSSPEGTYNTVDRIKGLLTVVSEELHDVPLYHMLDSVCSIMHTSTPKMVAFRSAILHQGYRVSISHANSNAVKTDAPLHVFWDIMRCWVKQNPIKTPSPTSPCGVILSQEPKTQASFEIRKDANPPSRLLKLTRFPENPESYWGPKSRAKRKKDNPEELPAKRQRLQGKRSKKQDHSDDQ